MWIYRCRICQYHTTLRLWTFYVHRFSRWKREKIKPESPTHANEMLSHFLIALHPLIGLLLNSLVRSQEKPLRNQYIQSLVVMQLRRIQDSCENLLNTSSNQIRIIKATWSSCTVNFNRYTNSLLRLGRERGRKGCGGHHDRLWPYRYSRLSWVILLTSIAIVGFL